ncbi:hypothetical protein CPB86DRAFT_789902 [Serendipita vermifera]|nr:hypothetical protein CPB86DRAFT_789902 [Serendipita vermifera]
MNHRASHLTLKHFVLRVKVLSFYRDVVRASRHIPDPGSRKDTVKWLRGEMEQSSGLTDTDEIEQRLSYLQRLMKQVLPGFELAARTRKQKKPSSVGV